MINWFELDIIYSATSRIDEEDESDSLLKDIKLKASGETKYKIDKGFFNLGNDPIVHIAPMYLMDDDFKKYLSLIVFDSGNTVTAVGKPERIYKQLNDYVATLPIEK